MLTTKIFACRAGPAPLITQTVWGVLVTAIASSPSRPCARQRWSSAAPRRRDGYLLARQMRAARAVALLAALVLAANPLFIILAHSFMTDVPMLALTLYALLAFGRALQSGSRLAWGVGTLITIAAVLCRQPGLVLAMGFVATAVLRQPDRRQWLVLSIVSLLLGAGALGLQVVMEAFGRRWEAFWRRGPCSACGRWGRAARCRFWSATCSSPAVRGPLPAAAADHRRGERLRAAPRGGWGLGHRARGARRRGAVALVVGPLPAHARQHTDRVGARTDHAVPDWYIRDIRNDRACRQGSGGRSRRSAWSRPRCSSRRVSPSRRAGLWRRRTQRRGAGRASPRCSLFANALLYLCSVCIAVQFDRYFLPLVPLLRLALLPADTGRAAPRRTRLIAALPLVLLAAYGVAGTHDYLAWNRARAGPCDGLQSGGVEARRIDGGLEFNAPLFYVEGAPPAAVDEAGGGSPTATVHDHDGPRARLRR